MEENVKELATITVQKMKIKSDQLVVDYKETFSDANYSNEVSKSSEQFVHPDLKYSLDMLKPHVVAICEMPEDKDISSISDPTDEDINDVLQSYIITGYSKGGSDESAGVTIIAQKILKSGQILNLTVPFTKYENELGEGYSYGDDLQQAIARCDYEVDAYLFGEKWGLKQTSLDFESEEAGTETTSQDKPKRGRKKKLNEIKVFDETA